jgi:ribosomal small subunit protein bTHX
MGKGDRKTRKGKIAIRSYGNKRPHSPKKSAGGKAAVVTKPAAKKAAPAASKKKA